MIGESLKGLEILRAAGKLGVLLLQLSPAFSPGKHALSEFDELLGAIGKYVTAIEFRNRNWVEGDQLDATLEYLAARRATLVSVDAPTQHHFTIMPSSLNAITNSRLGYLRLHGRNAALISPARQSRRVSTTITATKKSTKSRSVVDTLPLKPPACT